MRVSFAHLGNVYVFLEPYLASLGLEPVVPPLTSKRTLDIGVRACPEMICAPCKIIFGNYVEALELGAERLIMLGGLNVCRLGYAVRNEQDKLREMGFSFEAVTFSLFDAQADLVRVTQFLTGKPLWSSLGAVRFLVALMKLVDGLEKDGLRVRARERQRGDTDRLLAEAWQAIRRVRRLDEVGDLDREFHARLAAVSQDESPGILRIAFVGDPYTILTPFFNMDMEKKLAALGVEASRWFWLGDSLNLFPIKDWLGLGHAAQVRRAAAPYVRGELGGFGYSTVGETILLSRDGYDGLIHVAPFNCTPEVVAEGILLDYDPHSPVPILHLSFDEQTSDAGLSTRLEAYTDLLRRSRDRGRRPPPPRGAAPARS
jgi:predicted nucleotide-binding protein (sugar kinase/HSP70/actin superfamily)